MKSEIANHTDNETESYSTLAEIVNPSNTSLKVLYPGSGGDIYVPIQATNSDTFVHVEKTTIKKGYHGGPHSTRILKEAKKLGVESIQIYDKDSEAVLDILYRHPNDETKESRQRQVHFYVENYFDFWPPEYEDGYDILITKGEAPPFDTHDIQMKQLINKMRVGGYFISDRDIAWIIPPEFIGFSHVPTNGIEFACGPARLYKKMEQVKQETASQLFTIHDLLRTSLDLKTKTVWFEPVLMGKRPDILAQFPQIPMSHYEDQVYGNAARLEESLMAISKLVRTLPRNMIQDMLAGIGLYYLDSGSPILTKTFGNAFAGF